MYLEADLHGKWLVAIGMPLSVFCGAIMPKPDVWVTKNEMSQGFPSSFEETLLNDDDEAALARL